jgi:hypothetical protein
MDLGLNGLDFPQRILTIQMKENSNFFKNPSMVMNGLKLISATYHTIKLPSAWYP